MAVSTVAAVPPGTRFVMSHFGNDGGGGNERLFVSTSPDGLNWTALNNGAPVYTAPQGGVRDPAIIYANGSWWSSYTSGGYGVHDSFGLAKSPDLVNWQLVGEIPSVRPGATDQLSWGPYFFQDSDGSVHVFVALSLINGHQGDPRTLRTFELHPVNADWTQWSSPALVSLPSTVTNEFWVWKEGTVYHGIFVDFARQGAPYVHATATSLMGPYTSPKELPFYGQEGGFMLKKPEGGYRFYFESGNASASRTYWWSDSDSSFNNFTPWTLVTSSVGMRNGKPAAAIAGTTYESWRNSFPAATAAALANPLGDFDGDGLSNLAEYSTGSDPTLPAREARIAAGGTAAAPLATYRLASGLSDLTATLEVSRDLSGWSSGSAVSLPLSTTLMTDGTQECVVTMNSLAASERQYVRLSLTLSTAAPLAPLARSVTVSAPVAKASTPAPTAKAVRKVLKAAARK